MKRKFKLRGTLFIYNTPLDPDKNRNNIHDKSNIVISVVVNVLLLHEQMVANFGDNKGKQESFLRSS